MLTSKSNDIIHTVNDYDFNIKETEDIEEVIEEIEEYFETGE